MSVIEVDTIEHLTPMWAQIAYDMQDQMVFLMMVDESDVFQARAVAGMMDVPAANDFVFLE